MLRFHTTVQNYASRLRQSAPDDLIIIRFRRNYPIRFRELCILHLSFLIDIPWNFIEQKAGNPNENSTKSVIKRLLNGCRLNPNPINKCEIIPDVLAERLTTLIERLDTQNAQLIEGVFRKTGHTVRKSQLQEAMVKDSFDPASFDWSSYSVHDLAATLKSMLLNLPTPLLTKRLMPLFLQVAALRRPYTGVCSIENISPTAPSCSSPLYTASESHSLTDQQYNYLIESKQLKAMRLLIQLLPSKNVIILKTLMRLLSNILKYESVNRMSADCLGTIFSAVLLSENTNETVFTVKNDKCVASEFHERCMQSSKLITALIRAGEDIFLLPITLVEDIHTNHSQITNYISKLLADNLGNINTRPICHSNTDTSGQVENSSKVCNSQQLLIGSIKKHTSKSQPNNYPIGNHSNDANSPPPLSTHIRFATNNTTPTSMNGSHTSCLPSNNFYLLRSPLFQGPLTVFHNSSSNSSNDCLLNDSFDLFKDDYKTPRRVLSGKNSNLINYCYTCNVCNNSEESCLFKQSTTPNNQFQLANKSSNGIQTSSANSFTPVICRSRSSSMDRVSADRDSANVDICLKKKIGHRRRFTELRAPSSISRPSKNNNRSTNRRRAFSPCPPISFPPFRRVGADKQNLHTSHNSVIDDSVYIA